VPGEEDGARELGRFLRSRRERLRPAVVGLPVGPRRRVAGLRREEVARLAHLSPTWYAYLEQGRQVIPSPAVLDSLVRALRLTEDERAYLYELARRSGGAREPEVSDAPAELIEQVVALHAASEFPVYACNRYLDVLAWNRAAREWYDDWAAMADDERNLIRWILLSPVARRRIVDWEAEVGDVVARWRSEAAHRPDDARLAGQIREYRAASPLFARCWDDHEVIEHRTRTRTLRHDVLGVRRMRVLPLVCPAFPHTGLMVHFPEQDATAPGAPHSGRNE
jgi:transcriptional regulator with XRE-family HTH domain